MREKLLEKMTIKKLLLPYQESLRDSIKVVIFPVKGYPEGYITAKSKEDGLSSEFNDTFYPQSELIGRTGISGDILLYRKAFPHCLYGMMAIKNNNSTETDITNIQPEERNDFYKLAKKFAVFCKKRGLYPCISWTFDPETRDRKSGQSQLWYHMHLSSYNEKDKIYIQDKSVELKSFIGAETKRSFVDEFSIVFSCIAIDYIRHFNHPLSSMLKPPFSEDGLPNLSASSDQGWDFLCTKEFDDLLIVVHKVFKNIYDLYRKELFIGDSAKWQRPHKKMTMVDLNQPIWMSDSTFELVKNCFKNLNSDILSSNLDKFISNPKSKLTSHLYPLGGMSYATTITMLDGGKLLISFRPQMFSDTGAAGLHHMFGTTIKLSRGEEVYSDSEIEEKVSFEESFLEYTASTK